MDVVVMSATIFITGAGGFTGRHACAYFRMRGLRVVAGVRNAARHKTAIQAEHIVSCDFTDPHAVKKCVQAAKPDYVLHLAGMNDVRRSWLEPLACMQVNVSGTLHLLGAVAELSTKPIVLVVGSSLSFNPSENPPRPAHPYALSKTMQSVLARSWTHLFGLPILSAEPCNLIGPGSSAGLCGLLADYVAKWEKGMQVEPFKLSSLSEKRDYLDVRDAVRAYERILFHGTPGSLYRFGSGQLRPIKEVVQAFEAAAGRSFPYIVSDQPPRDKDPQQFGTAIMERLGWRPQISFAESVREILRDARLRLARRMQGEEHV